MNHAVWIREIDQAAPTQPGTKAVEEANYNDQYLCCSRWCRRGIYRDLRRSRQRSKINIEIPNMTKISQIVKGTCIQRQLV